MTASTKVELNIEPGFEGTIRLVAVPPVSLKLTLDRWSQSGRKYTLVLKGTHQNLAPPGGGGEAPRCRVTINANSQGVPRIYELSTSLNVQGESCGAEVVVDALEAGLIGNGTAELSVRPEFPFAEEHPIIGTISFDNPLDIEGAEAGQTVCLGKRVKFEPRIASIFKTVKLRLSVYRTPPPNGQHSTPYSVFEWTRDEDDTRTWRVGCAESDGARLLTYLDVDQDEYSYDFVLEAFDEQEGNEVRYVLWERPAAITFAKPVLKSFQVQFSQLKVVIDHVDPDYSLPLELSLWRHDTWGSDPGNESLHIMNPVSRPAEGDSASAEFFFDLIEYEVLKGSSHYFGLLRIPRGLSGTEEHVPISTVMRYDPSQFLPFDDDELWLEPPRKKGGGRRSKRLKTPRELATAVASSELKIRPERLPHFGAITPGFRDRNLLVGFKVVGEPAYWKDAAPVFSLQDESGQSELMKLDARPTAENPRLYEALVPLEDKRLFGRKVKLQAKVSNPGAQLWGESVVAPPVGSLDYEGTPRLSDVTVQAVNITDATTYIQLQAHARHIPNGARGSILGFHIQEIVSDLKDPIAMQRVHLQYDIPKRGGGLCDSRGLLRARVTEPHVVEELERALHGEGPGQYLLRACVLDDQGKVLNTEVAPARLEFGDTPRSVEGSLIYGKLVSPEFRRKVIAICDDLQIDPQHLMACMAFETGMKFRADTPNRDGQQAYGLIQFTPAAAKLLQVELAALRGMTELEQLDYVQQYFAAWIREKKTALKTLGDVYACIICPAAIGKPDSYVCYAREGQDTVKFEKNKGLAQGKSFITKADITIPVKKAYDLGLSDYRFP